MPSPFPGMDPWLEAPAVFPGMHYNLVFVAADMLLPQLRPLGYFADKNERVWIEESDRNVHPDVVVVERRSLPASVQSNVSLLEADEPVRVHALGSEFREPFLEIFDTESRRLITSIEFLSPTNKRTTQGRRLFQQKRKELRRGVNLVEIDFLRAGRHLLAVSEGLARTVKPWEYLVCLTRPKQRDYELYPIRLRERLPRIHIPLKAGEPDAVLDLQLLVERSYDSGPYPDRLDYNAPPTPPLSDDDADWADGLLRKAGLRTTAAP